VILATGATYAARSLPGAYDVTTALAAPRDDWVGMRVAILDDAGSWATLSIAETLAASGATVDVIAVPGTALWSVTLYSRMTALERLAKAGVRMRNGLVPVTFEGNLLSCRVVGSGETIELGPFDQLVHSDPGAAASALHAALEAAGMQVRAIGDAVAPRTLFDAMYDAHAVVRGLEDRL
jgi:hypothetical protein